MNNLDPSSVPSNAASSDASADASVLPIDNVNGTLSRPRRSRRAVVAALILGATLVMAMMTGLRHLLTPTSRPDQAQSPVRLRERPAAAGAEPRTLEMPAAASTAGSAVRVPALAAGPAEPIAVRATAPARPGSTTRPEDAPAMLVSARAPVHAIGTATPPAGLGHDPAVPAADPLAATSMNLQDYQRQLQIVVDRLTRAADDAAPRPREPAPGLAPEIRPPAQGLFDGQLQASVTPTSVARQLTHRSLILPKGTAFTCVLKTRIISATSGLVGCQVQRDLYGDDGRVLLIERGSHVDGEYRLSALRPGMVRIPVIWTRLRTPLGVTVDLASPATGPLGESGIDGHVDRRWSERIGAAMLLSLIDDSVKLVIESQRDGDRGTVVLPATTSNTSKLAEKVLDSTINIPPLVYRDQGSVVGIYVARDIDFSSVYDLVPVDTTSVRP